MTVAADEDNRSAKTCHGTWIMEGHIWRDIVAVAHRVTVPDAGLDLTT